MVRRKVVWAGALASLLLAASRSNAETVVTEGAETATWTKAGSPYLVRNSVEFQNLTVEAGTIVRAAIGSDSRITVAGSFIVTGTRAEPAVFETLGVGSTTARWAGVWPGQFDVTGAIFRHAAEALLGGTTTAKSRVSQSVFEENGWAIESRGDLDVDAVAFIHNDTALFGLDGAVPPNVNVSNCTFLGGDGIAELFGANVSVNSSTFHSVFGPVATTRPSTIRNSILVDVQFATGGYGATTVSHSSVWPSSLTGEVIVGDAVVLEDPQLVSASDLHLRPTSPCIDSANAEGAPDHDLDGEARPVGRGFDKGAYEFPQLAAGGEGGAGGAGGWSGDEDSNAGSPSFPSSAAGSAGAGSTESSAGATNGSGSAGLATSGATAGSNPAPRGATDGVVPTHSQSSACGCRAAGSQAARGEEAALTGVLGLALLRRRARRRPSTGPRKACERENR